jgi:hypothetical protein
MDNGLTSERPQPKTREVHGSLRRQGFLSFPLFAIKKQNEDRLEGKKRSSVNARRPLRQNQGSVEEEATVLSFP